MHESLQERRSFMQRLGGIAVEIVGPALIMMIVGSLAFFLIEIFYNGPYDGRMKWVFGLFVFAAVLISRISIEIGSERAYMYGFVLMIAALIVANRFMQSDTIFGLGGLFGNALLLIVIWWCSARLTWDCTFIDQTRDATGQGMLDLAVDRVNRFRSSSDDEAGAAVSNNDERGDEGATNSNWVMDIFFQRRQPNTPGLWVFYFLIAGLPIFGLGQMFLGMSNTRGHYNASIDFAIYMFGTLSLLMMTSMTGLHRYLEKRSAAMPSQVAKRWMILGTCLALCIVVVTFLLPRPTPRYAISSWLPKLTSPDLQPSDVSFGKDGQRSSDSNSNINAGPRSNQPDSQQQGNGNGSGSGQSNQGSNSSSGQGSQNDPNSENTREGNSGSGGNHNEGSQESSGSSSQSGGEQSGRSQGEQGSNQQHQGNEGSQQEDSSDNRDGESNQNEQGGNNSGNSEDSGQPGAESQLTQGQNNRTRGPQKNEPGTGSNSSSNAQGNYPNQQPQSEATGSRPGREGGAQASAPRNQPNSPFTDIGRLFKFLLFLVVVVLLMYLGFRYRNQLMPAIKSFLAELADFWRRLFEKKPKKSLADAPTESKKKSRPHVGFAHYQDPFANGKAAKWETEQIVKYTFAALEAWARDHGCPREEDQTPHEFVKALAKVHKPLAAPTRYLADLYCELAYSKKSVSHNSAMKLADVWQKMNSAQSPQLSVVQMA